MDKKKVLENMDLQNTENTDFLSNQASKNDEQDQILSEIPQQSSDLELPSDDPLVKGKKEGDIVQITAVIDKIENGQVLLTVQKRL